MAWGIVPRCWGEEAEAETQADAGATVALHDEGHGRLNQQHLWRSSDMKIMD